MLSSSPRVPRRTLAWGGAGIVVATLTPLASQTIFRFPPVGRSWLYEAWQPVPTAISAMLLVVAFMVLAVGLGKEPGIVGPSLLGKVSLIVFPVTGLVLTWASLAPSSFLSPRTELSAADYTGTATVDWNALALAGRLDDVIELLGLAALIVASVFVVRSGAVSGVARWGLPALALVVAVQYAVERGPIGDTVTLAILPWVVIAVPLIQLVAGALFALHPRAATRRPRLTAVPQ